MHLDRPKVNKTVMIYNNWHTFYPDIYGLYLATRDLPGVIRQVKERIACELGLSYKVVDCVVRCHWK